LLLLKSVPDLFGQKTYFDWNQSKQNLYVVFIHVQHIYNHPLYKGVKTDKLTLQY